MSEEAVQDAPKQGPKVTIDGVDYAVEDLSDKVKASLAGVRACDVKIQQLQQELSIVQTARSAYAGAVKGGLPTGS